MMENKEQILQEFNIENCRVCIDVKQWRRKAQKLALQGTIPETIKSSPMENDKKGRSTMASTTSELSSSSQSPTLDAIVIPTMSSTGIPCPPHREELGRNTWTFLHTMAAHYPDHPTSKQQEEMSTFIRIFSHLYPCAMCSAHFRAEMQNDPPTVQNRSVLSQWFCRMHNQVNELLGKPLFNCNLVDERWRTGPSDDSCDVE